jgi:hypothetical protein
MNKTILRAALGVCVTALASGLFAGPALAAEPAGSVFDALTEKDSTGKTKVDLVKPGEVSPTVLGVANAGSEPLAGAVVNIRAFDDADLLGRFENCQYYTYSSLDGAWCEFDQELAPGATYALSDSVVGAAPEPAWKEPTSVIIFRWITKEEAAAQGGIQALAKRDSRTGEAVPGTGGKVTLVARDLPRREKAHPLGFAYLKVVAPSPSPSASASVAPSASPSPSASASASASPSVPAGAGGAGGGLPVTGTAAGAVAGMGVALLVTGGVGYLVARRRRTRFVA